VHIPELLFSLPLLKDRRTQQIEHIVRRQTVLGTSDSIAFADLYDTAPDRFFVVQHVGCQGVPFDGSGGLLHYVALEAIELAGSFNSTILATFVRGSAVAGSILQMAAGPAAIWVGPNVRLRAWAFWSNSFPGHQSSLSISGLSIPRGNVARG